MRIAAPEVGCPELESLATKTKWTTLFPIPSESVWIMGGWRQMR